MNFNTAMTIILAWSIGLLAAVALAKLGYPWLALLVILATASIRIHWGDEKDDEDA